MARLQDPKVPARFTPSDQLQVPEARRVVYLIKVPTEMDLVTLDREIALRNGRRHHPLARLAALRRGLEAIYAEISQDPPADVMADLDAYHQDLVAFYEQVSAGGFAGEDGVERFAEAIERHARMDQSLAELADIVAQGAPAYAAMRADDQVYPQIQGYCAARQFVVGWENLPHACERTLVGLSEQSIAAIPRHHRIEIGQEVRRISTLSETERGNSASPSPGSSGEAPSTAAREPAPTAP